MAQLTLAQDVTVYPLQVEGHAAIAIGNGELIIPGPYGSEEALAFSAKQHLKDDHYSALIITPTRIIWTGKERFEFRKADVQIEVRWLPDWGSLGSGDSSYGVLIKSSSSKYKVFPCAVAVEGARTSEYPSSASSFRKIKYINARDKEWTKWAQLALSDFSVALQRVQELTKPIEDQRARPKEPPSAKQIQPPAGSVTVFSQPTGVQVYLDDQARGVTSEQEGKLGIGNLAPGDYKLRLSRTGYNDWVQSINIESGDQLRVEAKLVSAGPKPLEAEELEELLRNGVPKSRITGMVNQYGVGFLLTPELEEKLRKMGADGDLLLAIMKAKK